MKRPLYLMSSGALARRQNTLVLETSEGKRYLPVEQVAEIHAFGEVDFNKRLWNSSASMGSLCMCIAITDTTWVPFTRASTTIPAT